MIKFTYRQITTLINLIEIEIEKVKAAKNRLLNSDSPIMKDFNDDEKDAVYVSPEEARYNRELASLTDMRDNFERELDKLEFTMNVGNAQNLSTGAVASYGLDTTPTNWKDKIDRKDLNNE